MVCLCLACKAIDTQADKQHVTSLTQMAGNIQYLSKLGDNSHQDGITTHVFTTRAISPTNHEVMCPQELGSKRQPRHKPCMK
jgi:hypothetical protein